MYAGGFSKEKGVYDLIEAFEKANLKESKLNIYGYFPDDIKEKYKYNKSILFHGFVTQEELFNSYANNDIVVNPHKLILNNNYIFPYKNIEIFSSGAFPLVSKESILGLNSLKIRKLCTFKNLNQLKNKLKNAEKLWKENINIFQDSQKLFIKNYSEEKILYDVRRVFEN
jgi:glycosyltransferase involved in cell wall biosynthesis